MVLLTRGRPHNSLHGTESLLSVTASTCGIRDPAWHLDLLRQIGKAYRMAGEFTYANRLRTGHRMLRFSGLLPRLLLRG